MPSFPVVNVVGNPCSSTLPPRMSRLARWEARWSIRGSLFLYNYVFIHASENEIFRLKRIMPLYNLLPRVSVGEHSYFPYLSDHEMETLRWMAESYSNELPVYVPDSGRLLKGDRVRITSGSFMGMEAEVVVQPGGGHKDVMVRILDCMWVPLFEVRQGEYELIELNTKGKHVYTHLDNDRLSEGMHKALGALLSLGQIGKGRRTFGS